MSRELDITLIFNHWVSHHQHHARGNAPEQRQGVKHVHATDEPEHVQEHAKCHVRCLSKGQVCGLVSAHYTVLKRTSEQWKQCQEIRQSLGRENENVQYKHTFFSLKVKPSSKVILTPKPVWPFIPKLLSSPFLWYYLLWWKGELLSVWMKS